MDSPENKLFISYFKAIVTKSKGNSFYLYPEFGNVSEVPTNETHYGDINFYMYRKISNFIVS